MAVKLSRLTLRLGEIDRLDTVSGRPKVDWTGRKLDNCETEEFLEKTEGADFSMTLWPSLCLW